ncbi:hypothetical protein CCMA1212_005467 [Trichoderma ghanense]|uniref:Beta-lactamase-related domain-containing protein n=1 Tax=Trichoderma ghanense TaxID=65468 RepID=A0ABY2H597_9HYPO
MKGGKLMRTAKPMTTQTLFGIGSASMSLAAAAVALLVAGGQCPEVRYDAEVAKLLPGQFVMPGKRHEGVTVEDILESQARDGARPDYNDQCAQSAGADSPVAQGAGSIVTNVDDYIKGVEGPHPAASIVSQGYEKLHTLRSPTLCAAEREVFYYCGGMVVAHGGRAAGSSATSFFAPAVKFGAVIFGNTESAAAAGELLMQELLDEVLDIPRKQRLNQNQRIQLLSRSGLYNDAFHSKANKEIDAKQHPRGRRRAS